MSDRPRSRWLPRAAASRVLLLAAFAVGATWRLWNVDDAFLFGDELHALFDVPLGYGHVLSHWSATGSGMALPLLQRIAVDLFGTSHWSVRAPAWIPGVLLLPITWLVGRRWLGERAALVATWLVAASPLLVFYSRFARAYALVALLAVLLIDRVCRLVSEREASRGTLIGIALLVALLPWAHPTALGAVVPIVAGGLVALGRDAATEPAERRRRMLGLGIAFGAGGLLCLAAHGPAYESLRAFVGVKTTDEYAGGFGPLDVIALVGGGRVAGGVLVLAAAAGTGVALRRAGARALPLALALVGPPIAIAAISPYGDAYAYARYVIAAVAPACALAALALDRAAAGRSEHARALVPWVGAALALAMLVAGPPGPLRESAPQHANTYLGMLALPSFDAPWPQTPRFYRDLADRDEAGEVVIVEAPALTTRTRHLYRHYQLQHGARTLLAPLAGEFPLVPPGPYVALQHPDWPARTSADYLVVHRDVAAETARYWQWVYGETGPASLDGPHGAYLARHARYGGLLPRPSRALLAMLGQRFGEPVYRDETILVFRVADGQREAGD